MLAPPWVPSTAAQSIAAAVKDAPIAESAEVTVPEAAPDQAQTTAPPPRAFEYSDGYRMRAKIHRISSFATLPLFATEAVLGQSLYSDTTSGKKDAHLAVAGAMGALFAVNTTTGVWNLIEARKDPVHRKRRLVHGLMMLGADAGFVATAALGPSSEHGESEGSRSTHRAVAFTSIGLATASYLIMLFGGN
ncbi:MAG TPA: hypothetical protein VFJ02_20350 [Vicinamibacterales bacterium]|nr:hypothetical protein [Vicinamibacterales bacterium]